MKTFLLFVSIAFISFSFTKKEGKEVTIKTSAECNMCKERIEEKLNYTKGISFANLEVSSKLLTIKFKEDKITLAEIKTIITDLGYDADELKANVESQHKLPNCCKPNGMK